MTSSPPIWRELLSPRDLEVLQLSGQGARAGLGTRPVLLVVDVTYAFCGDRDEPIEAASRKWRTACGQAAWATLPRLRRLIAAARAKGLPVLYTTGISRTDGWDRGGWAWKNRRGLESTRIGELDGNTIMPQIAPEPTDIVIAKHKPSAFFGTALVSFLTQLGADSLIVAGGTTSGCVRASVVDAFSYNFRVSVAADCCFDRYDASHAMSLFDMNAKYADVAESGELTGAIERLEDGLFRLPGAAG